MTEEEKSVFGALKASWEQRGELIRLLCQTEVNTEKIVEWLDKQNKFFDE